MTPRTFANIAVADWSGEAVPRPKGLAIAHARAGHEAPALLRPAGGWSRDGIFDWLRARAAAGTDLLIGLDLSPALPFVDAGAYFPGWIESPADAPALWALIDRLSADDRHLGVAGALANEDVARYFRQHGGRTGDRFGSRRAGRLRVCEVEQQAMRLSPSSCFNLIGAAQVGKSSLTGMRVLHRLRGIVPVWPIDPLPAKGPAIVEIYTTIASRTAGIRAGLSKIRDAATLDRALAVFDSAPHAPLPRYDDHATDALLTAAWLRVAALDAALWQPRAMTPAIAAAEGWTFGVP